MPGAPLYMPSPPNRSEEVPRSETQQGAGGRETKQAGEASKQPSHVLKPVVGETPAFPPSRLLSQARRGVVAAGSSDPDLPPHATAQVTLGAGKGID